MRREVYAEIMNPFLRSPRFKYIKEEYLQGNDYLGSTWLELYFEAAKRESLPDDILSINEKRGMRHGLDLMMGTWFEYKDLTLFKSDLKNDAKQLLEEKDFAEMQYAFWPYQRKVRQILMTPGQPSILLALNFLRFQVFHEVDSWQVDPKVKEDYLHGFEFSFEKFFSSRGNNSYPVVA